MSYFLAIKTLVRKLYVKLNYSNVLVLVLVFVVLGLVLVLEIFLVLFSLSFSFNCFRSRSRSRHNLVLLTLLTISASGVRISDSKTTAIRKMEALKTKKAPQSTLGLLNYFRRHIPNYSARTHSM